LRNDIDSQPSRNALLVSLELISTGRRRRRVCGGVHTKQFADLTLDINGILHV
jgi:hypothetical protein